TYDYRRLSHAQAVPPTNVAQRLCPDAPCTALHVTALHLASGVPFAFEDR
ncbi:MAG: GntR family transcriptional regulator, partial [Roseovarius sp.]|nr:GntR family transcriptional regulator [Roseovarius sp.]